VKRNMPSPPPPPPRFATGAEAVAGEAALAPATPATPIAAPAISGDAVAVANAVATAAPARHWYLTADLRAATGLTRTAMDFYLRTGVVRPAARAESGYLLFDADELALLHRVLAWRARGISLRDIRTYLGRETNNGNDNDAGQTPDNARAATHTKAALP